MSTLQDRRASRWEPRPVKSHKDFRMMIAALALTFAMWAGALWFASWMLGGSYQ